MKMLTVVFLVGYTLRGASNAFGRKIGILPKRKPLGRTEIDVFDFVGEPQVIALGEAYNPYTDKIECNFIEGK